MILYNYLRPFSAAEAAEKKKVQSDVKKPDEEAALWEISPLLGNHLNFNQRTNKHELKEDDHPWLCWLFCSLCAARSCCMRFYSIAIELKRAIYASSFLEGRLFTWIYSMAQYVLIMMISTKAIEGNVEELEETGGESYLEARIEDQIKEYMTQYFIVAAVFSLLDAAVSLNRIFPFNKQMQAITDKLKELQDSEAGAQTTKLAEISQTVKGATIDSDFGQTAMQAHEEVQNGEEKVPERLSTEVDNEKGSKKQVEKKS